jgi:hypothetical protein
VPLTLPCSARWIVSMRKKSERKRGHENMRKHVMQRKLMLEVAKSAHEGQVATSYSRLTYCPFVFM